ncbi:MAG: glycosyltransferase family 2 protein [Dysgonamonadaceae bacterium]|jgi:glycosyltransferase involved in cell wall biosynthesis|nr:glycosyltransferase family 2 protein [Dysgonamonadaceae bacterium]
MNESGLSVIIPFLNEGKEVELTVENIRETALCHPDVILINDGSTDNFDYEAVAKKYNCRYIRHDERQGVAASRDEGVVLCETPYFILLDAHMEFYEQGWDVRLASVLQVHPRSLVGMRSWVLWESRENRRAKVSPTYGAVISMNETDIFKCKWNYTDPDPGSNIVEIACVLGGAYACSREYWLELDGLHGLMGYGMDEEMISLKVRKSGGRCLLIKDMVAGHVYRRQAPYEVVDFVLGNKIFVIELFFEGGMKERLYEKLRARYGEERFDRVYGERDVVLIERERAYLEGINRRSFSSFIKDETLKQ